MRNSNKKSILGTFVGTLFGCLLGVVAGALLAHVFFVGVPSLGNPILLLFNGIGFLYTAALSAIFFGVMLAVFGCVVGSGISTDSPLANAEMLHRMRHSNASTLEKAK